MLIGQGSCAAARLGCWRAIVSTYYPLKQKQKRCSRADLAGCGRAARKLTKAHHVDSHMPPCGSDVAPLWTAPRPCKSAAAGTMMLQAVNARVMDTLRRGVMRALILRNRSSLTPVNIFTTHPRSLIVCVLVCRRADARVGGCGRLGTPHGIRPTCILAPQRQADEQPGQ